MILLSIKNLSVNFGNGVVLDRVNVTINSGEKIVLLGRNGSGKSTLLKLISGEMQQDSGNIYINKEIQISSLPQEIPFYDTKVYEQLFVAFDDKKEELKKLYIEEGKDEKVATIIDVDYGELLKILNKIKSMAKDFCIDLDANFTELSAGLKRRVLLLRAILSDSDLLLLDEPTNHMDLITINYLEKIVKEYQKSVIIITHDRSLINKFANRILEIDRGTLRSFNCSYEDFLKRKEEINHSQEEYQRKFDKKLAQEEVWIRQGIKARRRRNEGRVLALKKMREERALRLSSIGKVKLTHQKSELSGKLVAELKNIYFAYKNSQDLLINNFSMTFMRGDRLGIVGRNGCGKSTLIKIILGELAPLKGQVRLGTNIEVAYFDQLRLGLDNEKSVFDNISSCSGADTVLINGVSRHIYSYLKDFLFDSDRARSKVKLLSGGEKNRLLLAKLFIKTFNLLVLDEPSNDLDIETLELLEELLLDYNGSLIMVSHDRALINNVVTSLAVFEGNGKITEYNGGYSDWQRELNETTDIQIKTKKINCDYRKERKRKLTYKEEKILEELPLIIENKELQKEELLKLMSNPDYYKGNAEEIQKNNLLLKNLDVELESFYKKWEELENIKNVD